MNPIPDKDVKDRARETSDGVVRLSLLSNQLGFLPGGDKRFVVESSHRRLQQNFWLCDADHFGENYRVFQGDLVYVDGDFGAYYTGDFSAFQKPGAYVLMVLDQPPVAPGLSYHSQIFHIAREVYAPVVEKGLECFALQRCGPSTTGYHSPCHLDDAGG